MHAIKLGFSPDAPLPSKPRVEISAAKREEKQEVEGKPASWSRKKEGSENEIPNIDSRKRGGEEKKRIDHCFSVSPSKTAFLDARVPGMVSDAKKGRKM